MMYRKPFILLLKSLFFAFAAVLVLCAAALVLVERNEDFIRERLVSMARERLGQPFSLELLDIGFKPWPVVVGKGLSTDGPVFSCTIGEIVAAPSFISLLTGDVAFEYISIVRPQISLRAIPSGSGRATDPSDALNGFFGLLPISTILDIENGSFFLSGKAEVLGIDGALSFSPSKIVDGKLFVGSLAVAMATGPLRVEDFLFDGKIDCGEFFSRRSAFTLKARLGGIPGIREIVVRSEVGPEKGLFRAENDIHGHLVSGTSLIPFSIKGPLNVRDEGGSVELAGVSVSLGGRDSATLNCTYRPAARSLEGKASIGHVSLTEWLGFARDLPPGLQRSLDDVRKGSLDFVLDAKKLEVRSVSAWCAGSVFSGRGGVADWRHPVVFLDMKASHVNLLRGIPEAGAVMPKPLLFDHPPLTPESSPDSPSSVGYDIRLGADQVAYGPLALETARVVIHPGPVRGRESPIVIDAKAGFYEGQLQGSCSLGGLDTVTYGIKLLFSEVNGAPLGRAMPVIPIRKGRWTGQVSVTSAGTALDDFLRQLTGTVTAEGKKGEFYVGSPKTLAFSSCQLRLEPLKSGQWKRGMLGLDGLWRGTIDFGSFQSQIALGGRLWFGETVDRSGFAFQGVPLTFSANGTRQTFSCKGKTNASWIPQQSAFHLADTLIRTDDADFSGQVDILTRREPTILAKGQWTVDNLPSLLSRFRGSAVSLPDYLKELKGTATLQATLQKLVFSDLTFQTQLGRITGNFGIEPGKQIKLLPDMTFDSVSLDDLLPAGRKSPAAKSRPPDFDGLDSLLVQGEILVKKFRVKKLVFSNLRVPLELERSVLTCDEVRGRLFDGGIRAKLTLLFHKGYSLKSSIILENANLARVSESTMEKGAMEGQCYVSASLKAAFASFAELPVRLFGSWSFRIADGIYQELDSRRRPKGSSLYFSLLQASGSVANGIVESKNIALEGKTLRATGKGEFNLKKQTIDSTLEVDMNGLPRFPLYIEGSLEKMKTTIGAGSLLLNAVGGLFSNILRIFR